VSNSPGKLKSRSRRKKVSSDAAEKKKKRVSQKGLKTKKKWGPHPGLPRWESRESLAGDDTQSYNRRRGASEEFDKGLEGDPSSKERSTQPTHEIPSIKPGAVTKGKRTKKDREERGGNVPVFGGR